MAKQPGSRSLVEKFVSELWAVIQMDALEVVRAALGEAAPKRRGPGRPRQAAVRGPGRPPKAGARRGRPRKAVARVRRSTADLEQTSARILAYVRSNPGQRLEEIGRGLDTATAGLKRPIQALLASGSLRTEGQKRGTRYFAGGRKGKGRAKGVKNVRGPKAAKAKARKANVRKTKRKARKARRPVRVVTVRPKATERVAVEAAAKTVPAETASAAT